LIEGKEQKLREEKRKILDSKMNDPSNSGKNDNPNNCENWLLAGTLFTLVIIRILWEALKWPGYEILAGSEAPPSSECIDGDEVVNITPTILFFGYVVMIGAIGLGSYFYELDLINTIVVAASRCVLQLSFLGFLLVPIFEVDNEALNVTYVFVMMIIATHEAMKRPKYNYRGLTLHIFVSLALALVVTAFFGLVVALQVGLSAQYVIPMCGMLMGNTMTGVAQALAIFLDELQEHPENIELFFALGATRSEALAAGKVLSKAVNVGVMPTIQTIAVLGVVSIPGMMTGQILGGSSPALAAKYQMMIYFMIGLNLMLGLMIALQLASHKLINSQFQLLRERLGAKGTDGWGSSLLGC